MSKPIFYSISPSQWKYMKFPFGPYEFGCDCKTCGDVQGWGIMFLFFGVRWEEE